MAPLAVRRIDELDRQLAEHARAQQAVAVAERGARLLVEGDQCLVDDVGVCHPAARARARERGQRQALAVAERARHLDRRSHRLAVLRIAGPPLRFADAISRSQRSRSSSRSRGSSTPSARS